MGFLRGVVRIFQRAIGSTDPVESAWMMTDMEGTTLEEQRARHHRDMQLFDYQNGTRPARIRDGHDGDYTEYLNKKFRR